MNCAISVISMVLLRVVAAHQRRHRQRRRGVGVGRASRTFPFDIYCGYLTRDKMLLPRPRHHK